MASCVAVVFPEAHGNSPAERRQRSSERVPQNQMTCALKERILGGSTTWAGKISSSRRWALSSRCSAACCAHSGYRARSPPHYHPGQRDGRAALAMREQRGLEAALLNRAQRRSTLDDSGAWRGFWARRSPAWHPALKQKADSSCIVASLSSTGREFRLIPLDTGTCFTCRPTRVRASTHEVAGLSVNEPCDQSSRYRDRAIHGRDGKMPFSVAMP